ncbi:IPP transferase-domain-containing protein [Pelagophyceae sp. CCMP2097]|nr:IPP transferase-domain-containing protein [Pelagophyceae sp. CCMP2097]
MKAPSLSTAKKVFTVAHHVAKHHQRTVLCFAVLTLVALSANALVPSTGMQRVMRRRFGGLVRAVSSGPERVRTKVVFIAGPTGVGKSALAAELCGKLQRGEIVSADSVQIYTGMDIGSNKPDAVARAEIRHHLIDVGDAREPWSAGEWCRAAAAAVDDVSSRSGAPIIVGGTMLYAQWFVHGLPDAPRASSKAAQAAEDAIAEVREANDWPRGLDVLMDAFGDAARAKGLLVSPNDWYRLSRLYEIEFDQRNGNGAAETAAVSDAGAIPVAAPAREPVLDDAQYDVRCVFVAPTDRMVLFRELDLRCYDMLSRGLLVEVADLVSRGLLVRDSTPGRAIGYRQALDYLDTELALRDSWAARGGGDRGEKQRYVDFCLKFATASRNYASQQIKWFRKERLFCVVAAGAAAAGTVQKLMALDREAYEAALESEAQAAVRGTLHVDAQIMKRFTARDPTTLGFDTFSAQLAFANAALATMRAARGDDAPNDDAAPKTGAAHLEDNAANRIVNLKAIERRRLQATGESM